MSTYPHKIFISRDNSMEHFVLGEDGRTYEFHCSVGPSSSGRPSRTPCEVISSTVNPIAGRYADGGQDVGTLRGD